VARLRNDPYYSAAAPEGSPSPAPDGAGEPLTLPELQADFAQFAIATRQPAAERQPVP
jgi:hypothetical protein